VKVRLLFMASWKPTFYSMGCHLIEENLSPWEDRLASISDTVPVVSPLT
jgi:hypothetical protein